MNRTINALMVGGLALGLLGCAGSVDERQPEPSPGDHALLGQIWDVEAGRFVDRSELMAVARDSEYVLLGEVHINAEHHRLQLEVLEQLAEQGRPPVVFEMLDSDQQHSIDAARAERPDDADYIAEVTRFGERGWQWPYYRPLVELALERDLPLLAGNPPAEQVRDVARGGVEALPDGQASTLGLDRPLPEVAHADLTERIVQGHCGHLTPEVAERLVPAQRIKDASMAEVLRAAEGRPAVLIAGSGHVRTDYGVPYYLRQRDPEARVLALGFVEVWGDWQQPADYLAQSVGQGHRFDYLWFTSRTEHGDPCEKFKEGLKRLKKETTPEG